MYVLQAWFWEVNVVLSGLECVLGVLMELLATTLCHWLGANGPPLCKKGLLAGNQEKELFLNFACVILSIKIDKNRKMMIKSPNLVRFGWKLVRIKIFDSRFEIRDQNSSTCDGLAVAARNTSDKNKGNFVSSWNLPGNSSCSCAAGRPARSRSVSSSTDNSSFASWPGLELYFFSMFGIFSISRIFSMFGIFSISQIFSLFRIFSMSRIQNRTPAMVWS